MAILSINENDYTSFCGTGGIEATDWCVFDKVYANEVPGVKLFESLKDVDNRFKIVAKLINIDGSLYNPALGSVARMRVWVNGTPSKYIYKYCGDGKLYLPLPLPYDVG